VPPPAVLSASAVATEVLAAFGAVHLREALPPSAIADLARAVRRLEFARAPRVIGDVRQVAQMAICRGAALASHTDLRVLTEDLGAAIRGLNGAFAPWVPNELTAMRYAPVSGGIDVHLDGRRYRHLVAIVSLAGAAELDVVGDRAGTEVQASFSCRPGDLVLLRGPGLGGLADGRPLHRIRNLGQEPRLSVTLRMDASLPPPAG